MRRKDRLALTGGKICQLHCISDPTEIYTAVFYFIKQPQSRNLRVREIRNLQFIFSQFLDRYPVRRQPNYELNILTSSAPEL